MVCCKICQLDRVVNGPNCQQTSGVPQFKPPDYKTKPKISLPTTSTCLFTEHILNDPSGNRIINKTFPNIYVITLLEDVNKIRLAHTKRVLKKHVKLTFCLLMSKKRKTK